MHSYLAIQNNYQIFEMALFIDNKLCDTIQQDKRHTSQLFIPLLNTLLTRNNTSLLALSFCAVNCGPGPFSTLRSIIASVNGLYCATRIPLIGIDGLEALFSEFYNPEYPYTAIILNAFNNDVYYLIAHRDTIIEKGYKKIDIFLEYIKEKCPVGLINITGNGVALHKELIQKNLNNQAIIHEPIIDFCSIEAIAHLGLTAFETKNYADDYLMPLHLKKHPVEENNISS